MSAPPRACDSFQKSIQAGADSKVLHLLDKSISSESLSLSFSAKGVAKADILVIQEPTALMLLFSSSEEEAAGSPAGAVKGLKKRKYVK
jgi:hypothetical protein